MFLRLILITLMLVLSVKHCDADADISVRFSRYDNPEGEAANGHCCDGKWSLCQIDGCDTIFTICVDDLSNDDMSSCRFGQKKANRIKNDDSMTFNDLVGDLLNPMVFHVQGQLPSPLLVIKVEVTDKDPYNDHDLIDFIRITAIPRFNYTQAFDVLGTRKQHQTRLQGDVSAMCSKDWYGNRCGTYCEPPTSLNNYRCDPYTGEKTCSTGWTGPDCWSAEGQWPTTASTSSTAAPTSSTAAPTSSNAASTSTLPDVDGPVIFVDRASADCDNLARSGYRYQDGVYMLHVSYFEPFAAYCDMSAEGWTVIQRRRDMDVSFFHGWHEYVQGFGEVTDTGNYWLGLRKIYWLTNQRQYRLRITMQIGNGEFRFAEYDRFWIENEANNFTLHVDGYSGVAGDGLGFTGLGMMRLHNGQPFSTFDRDNDNWIDNNCALSYQSGWWFNDCYWANLNGVYRPQTNGWPECTEGKCIAWRSIVGYEDYSLLQTEMEILPIL